MTRVLLVGAMATGKSAVGRALADLLGCPYLDNDDLLLASTGRTARALLAAEGEAALRDAESDVAAEVLATPAPWVASLAAGSVLDDDARLRVRDSGAFVVWLAAPAEVLAERVGSGDHRPWLDGDPLAVMGRLVAERAELYAEVADEVVDVSVDPARVVAERLAERFS